MSTSFSVRSAQRIPSSTSRRSAANSGPRWLIICRLAARRTRSGSGVGPGTRSCCTKAMSAPNVGVDAFVQSTAPSEQLVVDVMRAGVSLGVHRERATGDRTPPPPGGGAPDQQRLGQPLEEAGDV